MEQSATILSDPSLLLVDSLNDRIVKSLPSPIAKPLDHKLLFPGRLKRGDMEVPDWILLKEFMAREGRLSKGDLVQIVRGVMEVMSKCLFFTNSWMII